MGASSRLGVAFECTCLGTILQSAVRRSWLALSSLICDSAVSVTTRRCHLDLACLAGLNENLPHASASSPAEAKFFASEINDVVIYKGFCLAGCVECILVRTKCCVVRGKWRDTFFGSGIHFQKTSPSSLIRGFALRGSPNAFRCASSALW